MITAGEIKASLDATVVYGDGLMNLPVKDIYASDLMSDVLAFAKEGSLLLTGLATVQAIISAHMAELIGVVFIRGKKPSQDVLNFAQEHNMIVLVTHKDMFDACVSIYKLQSGRELESSAPATAIHNILIEKSFSIDGNDFANSGIVSTRVKALLKELGLERQLVRRAAISTYEAEMNVVMHAEQGIVKVTVTSEKVLIIVEDKGKGIPDVELALQEGYSTATEEMRALGFGSGMGLPNIKKNADVLNITSEVGIGTRLEIEFFLGRK